MTNRTQEGVNEISKKIKNDHRNIALYKARRVLYHFLLEVNFDNDKWQKYADKYEADLSWIIILEPTTENYKWRAEFLGSRLLRGEPKSVREFYPHNRYLDTSVSDYLYVLRHTSNPSEQAYIYTSLSWLYSLRIFGLASAPDHEKWLGRLPQKLILKDFDASLKYGRLANEDLSEMMSNLVEIYTRNADSASKLKLEGPAQKFQVEVIELRLRRAERFAEKDKLDSALYEYDQALALDQNDVLNKRGWLLIKRAGVSIRLNRFERAEADLAAAADTKYVLNCSQFYKARFQLYLKQGKTDMARKDLQTAGELRKNCQ